MEIKEILTQTPSKGWFRNRFHSLLRPKVYLVPLTLETKCASKALSIVVKATNKLKQITNYHCFLLTIRDSLVEEGNELLPRDL